MTMKTTVLFTKLMPILLNRHLSRKKKGSRGFENQRLKVAKLHEKIANCRADYLHKCSISLVRRYDTICVEDLNVKGMERNHHLANPLLMQAGAVSFPCLPTRQNGTAKRL